MVFKKKEAAPDETASFFNYCRSFMGFVFGK